MSCSRMARIVGAENLQAAYDTVMFMTRVPWEQRIHRRRSDNARNGEKKPSRVSQFLLEQINNRN